MATRYQYYNTGDDSNENITETTWSAMIFTPSVDQYITSIKIKVSRTLLPGTVTVSIQETTTSKPNGNEVSGGLGTFNGNTLTTDSAGEWKEITVSGAEVVGTTEYAIVVRAPSAPNSSNYVSWRYDNADGSYTGGDRCGSVNGGVDWISGGTLLNDDFMFEIWGSAVPPTDKTYSKKIIAIANNEVWYQSAVSVMSELSVANDDIDTTNPLFTAEAFQKLFVANKTNLKVADFVNVKLVTSTLSATNYPESGNILTGSGSGATMVVDYCSSLTGTASLYGKLTSTASFLSTDTVANSALSISFTLTAPQDDGPHWYNWTTYGNSTTFGTMPSSAYIICRYRGRLVLAGHPNYPHQWYMSKVGNPWDWLYGPLDPLGAVAGNNADAGECGDIIRALIPYGDDYLVFGCANSIWLLDGDPVSGGSLDEVSNSTGIYGQYAWCKDNDNNLYFWGAAGLYKMEGGRGRPKNISIVTYPKWVDDWAIDPDSHRVVLSFDPYRNGIIISKTDLDSGENYNYWYDLKTDGFYPESYPYACGIFSSIHYDSDDSSTRGLLLGCNDGYIRLFSDTTKSDDSGTTDTAVSSYMTLAPFPIGDGIDYEGKIKQIIFESSGGASSGAFSDSDGFAYGIYVADDAETCIEDVRDSAISVANLYGTISGTGRKSRIRQNIRGQYGTIRISNSTISTAFAINRILVDKDVAGRIKDV